LKADVPPYDSGVRYGRPVLMRETQDWLDTGAGTNSVWGLSSMETISDADTASVDFGTDISAERWGVDVGLARVLESWTA
jgi:hypothetical protein